jgi:hypothetical protein
MQIELQEPSGSLPPIKVRFERVLGLAAKPPESDGQGDPGEHKQCGADGNNCYKCFVDHTEK